MISSPTYKHTCKNSKHKKLGVNRLKREELQFIRILHLEVIQQRLIVASLGEATERFPISARCVNSMRKRLSHLTEVSTRTAWNQENRKPRQYD